MKNQKWILFMCGAGDDRGQRGIAGGAEETSAFGQAGHHGNTDFREV